jgi:hypothetical protein
MNWETCEQWMETASWLECGGCSGGRGNWGGSIGPRATSSHFGFYTCRICLVQIQYSPCESRIHNNLDYKFFSFYFLRFHFFLLNKYFATNFSKFFYLEFFFWNVHSEVFSKFKLVNFEKRIPNFLYKGKTKKIG